MYIGLVRLTGCLWCEQGWMGVYIGLVCLSGVASVCASCTHRQLENSDAINYHCVYAPPKKHTHMLLHTHIHTHIYIHACIYIDNHARTYMHACKYTDVQKYACTHVRRRIHTCQTIHARMHAQVHTYMPINTCTHACMHRCTLGALTITGSWATATPAMTSTLVEWLIWMTSPSLTSPRVAGAYCCVEWSIWMTSPSMTSPRVAGYTYCCVDWSMWMTSHH